MEIIAAFALVFVIMLPIGLASQCDHLAAERKQSARYQCVKDGHTVEECKELFP